MRNAALAALFLTTWCAGNAGAAHAVAPDPVAGRKYAQIECGGCHVVAEKKGKAPPAPTEGAPPRFATMALDPAMTAERIRETLRMPHGSMANLVISEKDAENIVSYISTLRAAPDILPSGDIPKR